MIENINTMQSKTTQIINSGNYLKTELQKLYDGAHISISKIDSLMRNEVPASE
jgi:hypothetical protein